MRGIETVVFIDLGNRIDGSAANSGNHDGVAYYFDSQANLDAFTADPARHGPKNEGFCTYGLSVGKKFDGDPRYAAVVDGKLYVFLNEQIFQLFHEDRAGTIATAAEQWQRTGHIAAAEL